MSGDGRSQSFDLTSFPPLVGSSALLVGLDEDGPNGTMKVYLGARYKRTFVLVGDDDAKAAFRSAWGSGSHVWLRPAPSASALHVDPAPSDAARTTP